MNLFRLWLDPDIVGFLSGTFTIALTSTGIWTCWYIISEKSVGSRTYLPFLCGALMSALWLLYGIVVRDTPMMVVNAVGTVLQSAYFIIFYVYTTNKPPAFRNGLIGFVFVSILYLIGLHMSPLLQVVVILGFICNAFTIAFFASPLASMSNVIKTKSTESMSLPLTVASLLVTFSWTLYGYIIHDKMVMFPNSLGFILALVQLSLFIKYPRKKLAVSPPSLTSIPLSLPLAKLF